MRKPIKQMTECEHCDRKIDLESPPLQEYYEQGRIDISEHSTILLGRSQDALSHAAFIDGYYCDLDCLISHLKELRRSA